MKMNTGLWFAFAAIAAGAGFFFLKKNKKFIDISKVHKETRNYTAIVNG